MDGSPEEDTDALFLVRLVWRVESLRGCSPCGGLPVSVDAESRRCRSRDGRSPVPSPPRSFRLRGADIASASMDVGSVKAAAAPPPPRSTRLLEDGCVDTTEEEEIKEVDLSVE